MLFIDGIVKTYVLVYWILLNGRTSPWSRLQVSESVELKRFVNNRWKRKNEVTALPLMRHQYTFMLKQKELCDLNKVKRLATISAKVELETPNLRNSYFIQYL